MTQSTGAFNTGFIWRGYVLVFASLFTTLIACADAGRSDIIRYQYQITAEQPHDPSMFTQGLFKRGELFYESGGRYGHSRLTRYRDDGHQVERQRPLDDRYFAEGLTELNGKLYLLTWRAKTLLIFDAESFEPLGKQSYRGEGWGLTDDGEFLIRSDGSAQLYFHDPENFQVQRQITVTEAGQPVTRLNELEYIEGSLWANIWHTDRLIQIDPDTGVVIGSLDLSELVREARPNAPGAVLNGIAYDPEHRELWVTGKLWPRLYRLSLKPEL